MTFLPGYPCPVCKRAANWATVSIKNLRMEHVCSAECAVLYLRHKGEPNLQNLEREAAFAGGKAGGQYLDTIGKTDLASLTKDEWGEFCFLVFAGTAAELRRLADDEIPF